MRDQRSDSGYDMIMFVKKSIKLFDHHERDMMIQTEAASSFEKKRVSKVIKELYQIEVRIDVDSTQL